MLSLSLFEKGKRRAGYLFIGQSRHCLHLCFNKAALVPVLPGLLTVPTDSTLCLVQLLSNHMDMMLFHTHRTKF